MIRYFNYAISRQVALGTMSSVSSTESHERGLPSEQEKLEICEVLARPGEQEKYFWKKAEENLGDPASLCRRVFF